MYYLSVYENLSKNSFFMLSESISRLAGAKVRLFSEPPKLFEEKIQFSNTFFIVLDFSQSSVNNTPFIICTRARDAHHAPFPRDFLIKVALFLHFFVETLAGMKKSPYLCTRKRERDTPVFRGCSLRSLCSGSSAL